MDVVDRIHNVPVPERFLPIVFKALAEAYRGEASAEVSGFLTPVRPPQTTQYWGGLRLK
jgi:hypothetical protein